MLVMKPENENEESRGTEGARRATGVAREAAGQNGDNPDPEVTNKAIRRRFSAAYKRRVVREANRCTKPGGKCANLSWKLKRLQTLWFDGIGRNNIKPVRERSRDEESVTFGEKTQEEASTG